MKSKNKISGFVSLDNFAINVSLLMAAIILFLLPIRLYEKFTWVSKQLECKENCETKVVSAEGGKKIITDKEGKQVIINKDNEILEVIHP